MFVYQWVSTLGVYRIFDSEHPEITIAIADNRRECKELIKILIEIDEGKEENI